MQRIAVVGGGPAGLMAAEVASQAGMAVDVYESKGSVGRKFLIAGRGGLNLTHSEDLQDFAMRYGDRRATVAEWLKHFDAGDVREWARGLGVDTFVGTSGRIFPLDLKAAPLLRAWVHRLRSQGVYFHVKHRCIGIDSGRELRFEIPHDSDADKFSVDKSDVMSDVTSQDNPPESGKPCHEKRASADAVVLAMGGGSWPQLGSDGAWVDWLRPLAEVAPLQAANCGFDVEWSPVFAQRFAGQPVKSVVVSLGSESLRSEFVVTATGVEGTAIYALSARLRDAIQREGSITILLDMAPELDLARLESKLLQSRGSRTLTEHLRRRAGFSGVKVGLLYEVMSKEDQNDMRKVAGAIKALPLRLLRARPLDEAISTAGGVRLEELHPSLMLKKLPGVFCAGEMLDWEAPTGGYLLTACLASGRVAGWRAVQWLRTGMPRS